MYNIAEIHLFLYLLYSPHSYICTYLKYAIKYPLLRTQTQILVDISIKSADISLIYTFHSSFDIRHLKVQLLVLPFPM
jgi:hypothetical protein